MRVNYRRNTRVCNRWLLIHSFICNTFIYVYICSMHSTRMPSMMRYFCVCRRYLEDCQTPFVIGACKFRNDKKRKHPPGYHTPRGRLDGEPFISLLAGWWSFMLISTPNPPLPCVFCLFLESFMFLLLIFSCHPIMECVYGLVDQWIAPTDKQIRDILCQHGHSVCAHWSDRIYERHCDRHGSLCARTCDAFVYWPLVSW